MMHRSPHFTRFAVASVVLHVLFFTAIIWTARFVGKDLPVMMPVNIVNLPQNVLRQLPPITQPVPAPPVPPQPVPPQPVAPKPERILAPQNVPTPKKFGTSEEVSVPKVPKTTPALGRPDGSAQGTKDTGRAGEGGGGAPGEGIGDRHKGPLPFLSQADIEEYARRGMPQGKPGDDSVTLDTDEFKFMSYNRWLKVKVESILRYPELAAQSGIQGTLYIKFDIMKDGSLGDLELLKSSGYRILDDEALRAIRASVPFQPLPDDWKMDRYSIRAAVMFYLNGAFIR